MISVNCHPLYFLPQSAYVLRLFFKSFLFIYPLSSYFPAGLGGGVCEFANRRIWCFFDEKWKAKGDLRRMSNFVRHSDDHAVGCSVRG